MTKETPRITLMGFFGMDPMSRVIETRLFGGPYLRFGNYVSVSAFLCQTGALLGRAKRDKLLILEQMLGTPERKGDLIAHSQQEAKQRLQEFGKEPDTFYMFVLTIELAKLGLSLSSDLRQLKKGTSFKVPLRYAEPIIKIWMVEGIGFGSLFPELTERMYRNAHENIDAQRWSRAREYGLALPEKRTIITLEEQEEVALSMLAAYAKTYYPALVTPLGF